MLLRMCFFDFSSSVSSKTEFVIISFKIPEENIEKATNLIDSMVTSVNNTIEGVFLTEIAKLKKTRQETYDEILKSYSENSNISDAQSLMLTVRQIDEFLQS